MVILLRNTILSRAVNYVDFFKKIGIIFLQLVLQMKYISILRSSLYFVAKKSQLAAIM